MCGSASAHVCSFRTHAPAPRSYVKQVEANVRASLASPAAAVAVAEAGLKEASRLFEFVREGAPTMSLAAAMDTHTAPVFEAVTIKGGGAKKGKSDLEIP